MFQLISSSYFISVNKLLENYANGPVSFPPAVEIGHQPPKSAILGLVFALLSALLSFHTNDGSPSSALAAFIFLELHTIAYMSLS